MELISREQVIQKIREIPIEFFGMSLTRKSVVKAELEELPIIESRHKGKWKKGFSHKYECSRCEQGADIESDYCAWCGADMRGEE